MGFSTTSLTATEQTNRKSFSNRRASACSDLSLLRPAVLRRPAGSCRTWRLKSLRILLPKSHDVSPVGLPLCLGFLPDLLRRATFLGTTLWGTGSFGLLLMARTVVRASCDFCLQAHLSASVAAFGAPFIQCVSDHNGSASCI